MLNSRKKGETMNWSNFIEGYVSCIVTLIFLYISSVIYRRIKFGYWGVADL
jgi:hypothetical protein